MVGHWSSGGKCLSAMFTVRSDRVDRVCLSVTIDENTDEVKNVSLKRTGDAIEIKAGRFQRRLLWSTTDVNTYGQGLR